MREVKASISEDHGIAALTDSDLNIYSVGISTGGVAEMRMAIDNPARHIVATTLDKKGVEGARKRIVEQHLGDRIEVKIEDVSRPLPYDDEHFDYIYARLVLHYLSEQNLQSTLTELRRMLKPGGKFFVVVRSADCPDAKREGATFDPVTHLTSGSFTDEETGKLYSYRRYFHTEESIRKYVEEAGFTISYTKVYDEPLYTDFLHTEVSPHTDNVIELMAVK